MDNVRNEKSLKKMNYMIDDIKFMLKSAPSYVCVYEGMGNYMIIRRKNQNSKLEGLYVLNDDIIYNTNALQQVKDFTNGYQEIDTMKEYNISLFHE